MEVRGQFSDLILFAHFMALRDQTENVRLGREHLHLLNPLTEPYVMHLHKLSLTLGVYFRYGLLPCLVYLDHHNNYVKKNVSAQKYGVHSCSGLHCFVWKLGAFCLQT